MLNAYLCRVKFTPGRGPCTTSVLFGGFLVMYRHGTCVSAWVEFHPSCQIPGCTEVNGTKLPFTSVGREPCDYTKQLSDGAFVPFGYRP